MTDMTAYRIPNSSSPSNYIPVLQFTLLFALLTYAAISMRAVLSPFEVNSFIDAKRAISVAIGAFILWLSIRAVDNVWEKGPKEQVLAVLNVAIPGAIGLLVAREAYDLAASGAFAERFALNLRWMLTWIGYFAAAIAAVLALGYHRQLQALRMGRTTAFGADLHSMPQPRADYESADFDFDPRRSA